MKSILPFLLVISCAQAQAPAATKAEPRFFHFLRTVEVPAGSSSQACAVLDPEIFAHASPTLSDLRLYSGVNEMPYAITISESTLQPPDSARVLNLGTRGGVISFDLEMPARSYTEVDLSMAGTDFLATAKVTGLKAAKDRSGTALGTFTLFDLSSQHLSRSTTIPLQESSFPVLHVELTVSPTTGSTFVPTPAMIQGGAVPPTREAQTLYTPVGQTTHFEQRGSETVAQIEVPAHLPIERVSFGLMGGSRTNFSRSVRITATANGRPRSQPEILGGEITRVRLPASGLAPEVDDLSLSFPATLGANLERSAVVEFAVENGDDRPLDLASASIEMRQRKVCFARPVEAAGITLNYGDPKLQAPVYDFARFFKPTAPTVLATLTREIVNPGYVRRPEPYRTLTERHPELLWLSLVGVIGVLGLVAFRSSKHIAPHS